MITASMTQRRDFIRRFRPIAIPSATRGRILRNTIIFGLLTGLAATLPAGAQQGATAGEWRSYGGDLGSTKYSPLAAIDATNFSKLEIAW